MLYYFDSTIWFLALALVENQNYDEAKKYLNQVAKWNGNKGKLNKANQAKKILELIKNQ